ncbi:PREDICTED: dormancy-associated protein homolog 4-like [Ipomoea nil]|uniref:dormancy-associated protein homolog 4-like n=1 Tax=Ipomoea nil TaxID=35883 RepID=UPI00090175E2|nr:PREDICTED: dormancy-associated protein homolog 4-like [Ipomoea nil]
MGFLDKLWDETLAGPAPEFGLGKLRKAKTFQDRPAGVTPLSVSFGDPPASAPATPAAGDQIPVSRSISIIRRGNSASPGFHAVDSPGSGPSSPATSTPTTTPTSPFSPSTPGGINHKKLARRNTTPTGYDWIVMSALDR